MNSGSITYPVDEVLPDVLRAFQSSNIVILSAPPGAGKTTRVPIALLHDSILNNGKLLMLEPRRLAARRAADFMSETTWRKNRRDDRLSDPGRIAMQFGHPRRNPHRRDSDTVASTLTRLAGCEPSHLR